MAVMNSLRPPSGSSNTSPFFLFLFLLVFLPIAGVRGTGAGVFVVQRKFGGGGHHTIADLKNHDVNRHARILSTASIDLPLGGNGLATSIGLYFTELSIGTPPKNFSVQVDTGSDILWVDCAPCDGCPKASEIGGELTPYDPEGSKSAKKLGCNEMFCGTINGLSEEERPKCTSDGRCNFKVVYGDGSSASGYYVTDLVSYSQVSGDHQTQPGNANLTFGCATQQTGTSDVGIEGLIGFGQANSSMISQLASSGKVRKIFAHCLDTIKGGGIFAIGNVVQPKVKMTPMVPKMHHYNVNMTSIKVGGQILQIPPSLFQTKLNRGTVIDSGTTLAYLPDIAYSCLMEQIFAIHPNLTRRTTTDNFTCFTYSESVDDAFPAVTFNFDMSVTLKVLPHEYFFKNKDEWCVAWQNGGDQYRFLLGDITLSNKLVIYDLENQTIGWTDYNCSSDIKVEDDMSKTVHSINAHALPSSASILDMGRSMQLLLVAFLLYLLDSLSSSDIKVEDDMSKTVHSINAHALPSSASILERGRSMLLLLVAFLLYLLNSLIK